MKYLQIPTHTPRLLVLPEQIVRVEASSNYSKIYFTTGKPVVVSKVLQWFQNKLPVHMFVRVHRSHLVNRIHVQHTDGGAGKLLLLTNGDTIAISRRKKANTEKKLTSGYLVV